jgi:hypothetical protein
MAKEWLSDGACLMVQETDKLVTEEDLENVRMLKYAG